MQQPKIEAGAEVAANPNQTQIDADLQNALRDIINHFGFEAVVTALDRLKDTGISGSLPPQPYAPERRDQPEQQSQHPTSQPPAGTPLHD